MRPPRSASPVSFLNPTIESPRMKGGGSACAWGSPPTLAVVVLSRRSAIGRWRCMWEVPILLWRGPIDLSIFWSTWRKSLLGSTA